VPWWGWCLIGAALILGGLVGAAAMLMYVGKGLNF